MALRTTAAEVQDILGDNYDGTKDVTPFMTVANKIVDQVSTLASQNGFTYDSTVLTCMEQLLAADYYTLHDPLAKSESAGAGPGRASASFHDRSYRKAALDLDFHGVLKAILEHNVASADWLGLVPSDQTDYTERD